MFVLKSKYRGDYLVSYCGWGQCFSKLESAMKFQTEEEAKEELNQLEKLANQDLSEQDAQEIVSDIEVTEVAQCLD